MEKKKPLFSLFILLTVLIIPLLNATPINPNNVKQIAAVTMATATTTTEKPMLQGKYFDEIMKELNEALKEKAAEEKRHLSLLMNMTAEMKELSEQVKGMKEKLKKIAGK